MKRLFFYDLLILFFATAVSYPQSNWVWQNPQPQGNDLNAVKFIGTSTGYSVGMKGTILKTINGGLNWNILPGNTIFDLFNLFFLDSQNGFVVGDSGNILSTTNGGSNWEYKIIDPNVKITGIDFTGSLNGWVSGFDNLLQSGVIYKTTDGGLNWVQNFTTTGIDYLKNIKFFNVNYGYAGGFGGLYLTTDAGLNWNRLSTTLPYRNDFLFIDSLSGIFIDNYTSGSTSYGDILKTTNGGHNFSNYISFRDTSLNSVCYADTNTWFIAGNKGIILKTTNFGNNWLSLNTNTSYDFNSIYFSGFSNGLTVGKSGSIVMTSDQGVSWSHQDKGNISNFTTGQFVNSKTAFVSGQNAVVKTSDSGENWFSVWDGACSENKYSIVYFLNENTGWLCFPSGDQIYKTNNGGLNWISSGTYGGYDYYPRAMFFIDELKGFLVGKVIVLIPPGIQQIYGFLLQTSNGGQSWSIYSLPSNSQGMNDIKFVNSSTGIIVGGNSSIVKTTNGGNNWFNAVSLFDYVEYAKICFINENTGWLLGRSNSGGSNKICKTTNAGFSWSNITGEAFYNIYSFQFLDESNAWMCGAFGSVYASSNGGSNWIRQLTPTNNTLTFINFINSRTGWISGNNSSILKTTSGIIPVSIDNQNEIYKKAFTLNQNFPNPFNPGTVIKYTITESQHVLLKVYDIRGKVVSTLVNEKQSPGNHEVEFTGEKLSSGIYFYRLETGKFSESKKMILLK